MFILFNEKWYLETKIGVTEILIAIRLDIDSGLIGKREEQCEPYGFKPYEITFCVDLKNGRISAIWWGLT